MFYILFFFVHVISTFVVSVEIYYRWQLDVKQSFIELFKLAIQYIRKKPQGVHNVESGNAGERTTERKSEEEGETKKRKKWTMMQLFEMYKKEGLCPPKHKVRYSLASL